MKKLYYRLLLTLVVLACGMPFVIKGKDGRPLMTVADLKMPAIHLPGKEVVEALNDSTAEEAAEQPRKDVVTVYRWQDDQGIWHFSDDANPDGASESVLVDVNASVTKTAGGQQAAAPAAASVDIDELLQPQVLPILNAGEALRQTRNVEKLMQQRYQDQEQMLSR